MADLIPWTAMQTSSFQPTAQERIHGYSVQRLSAFAAGDTGGNPAGVVISEHLPDAATMQAIAADVGYSETAFAAPEAGVWRVRYFAPEIEIPFCGHATIALGAALAARHGEGRYALQINDALISVQAHRHDGQLQVACNRRRPAASPQRQSSSKPAFNSLATPMTTWTRDYLPPWRRAAHTTSSWPSTTVSA